MESVVENEISIVEKTFKEASEAKEFIKGHATDKRRPPPVRRLYIELPHDLLKVIVLSLCPPSSSSFNRLFL